LVEFESELEGDLLLRVYEQQSLWLGIMSEVCIQSMFSQKISLIFMCLFANYCLYVYIIYVCFILHVYA